MRIRRIDDASKELRSLNTINAIVFPDGSQRYLAVYEHIDGRYYCYVELSLHNYAEVHFDVSTRKWHITTEPHKTTPDTAPPTTDHQENPMQIIRVKDADIDKMPKVKLNATVVLPDRTYDFGPIYRHTDEKCCYFRLRPAIFPFADLSFDETAFAEVTFDERFNKWHIISTTDQEPTMKPDQPTPLDHLVNDLIANVVVHPYLMRKFKEVAGSDEDDLKTLTMYRVIDLICERVRQAAGERYRDVTIHNPLTGYIRGSFVGNQISLYGVDYGTAAQHGVDSTTAAAESDEPGQWLEIPELFNSRNKNERNRFHVDLVTTLDSQEPYPYLLDKSRYVDPSDFDDDGYAIIKFKKKLICLKKNEYGGFDFSLKKTVYDIPDKADEQTYKILEEAASVGDDEYELFDPDDDDDDDDDDEDDWILVEYSDLVDVSSAALKDRGIYLSEPLITAVTDKAVDLHYPVGVVLVVLFEQVRAKIAKSKAIKAYAGLKVKTIIGKVHASVDVDQYLYLTLK